MRTRAAQLFLASMLILALSGGQSLAARKPAHPPPAPPPARTTVQEVSEGLTCQCGCGLTVANCNHPTCSFSVPLRTQIDGLIKTGMSRADIIAFFRRKYGEKVLSAPTTEGFNILAWITPFAALFAGAILILFAVGRWRSAAPARAPTLADPAAGFDPRLKQLLERELVERS